MAILNINELRVCKCTLLSCKRREKYFIYSKVCGERALADPEIVNVTIGSPQVKILFKIKYKKIVY